MAEPLVGFQMGAFRPFVPGIDEHEPLVALVPLQVRATISRNHSS
jgi:hypothetical protein